MNLERGGNVNRLVLSYVEKHFCNWLYHHHASFLLLRTGIGSFLGNRIMERGFSFQDLSIQARLNRVLECIGILTIAVAAFELGQTIYEEEVQRQEHLSAPTRVRRFVSRFLVVLIVSLSIESLVAAFKFVHEDPAQLPRAAMIALSAAALLAAWGIFVYFNRYAEELEPEAMGKVKNEDHEIET